MLVTEKQSSQNHLEMIELLNDQPYVSKLDLSRDLHTFSRRYRHEGFKFVSNILPKLGKAFDLALSGNATFSVTGLFKKAFGTCLPHFLGSALRRIFTSTGELLEDPCVVTIKWLRTFFYYSYKVEVPFDEQQIHDYSESFKETDSSLAVIRLTDELDTYDLRRLMRDQLKEFDNVELADPANGPGVSSNCTRTQKYNQFVPNSAMRNIFGRDFFHQWFEHRDREFITIFVLQLSPRLLDFMGIYVFMNEDGGNSSEEDFSPSSILFVPKDSRGPRVICCEDSRRMYAQKSLQKALYRAVETSRRFAQRVNFTDQSYNQKATFDPNLATLDLKDASDRVSLDLVMDVFPQNLQRYMLACRSPEAVLPNGDTVVLNKFAPMGSALCFPVLALVVYTCATSAIHLAGGPHPAKQEHVLVYGDDIIVPNEYASVVIKALESVGLLVNKQKSFIDSRFRESCGQDTFDQSTVTPLRQKHLCAPVKKDRIRGKVVLTGANWIPAYVSLANRALREGFVNLSSSLFSAVEKVIGTLPYGNQESGYLCRWVGDELYAYNQA